MPHPPDGSAPALSDAEEYRWICTHRNNAEILHGLVSLSDTDVDARIGAATWRSQPGGRRDVQFTALRGMPVQRGVQGNSA
jgi:hypothetical protein